MALQVLTTKGLQSRESRHQAAEKLILRKSDASRVGTVGVRVICKCKTIIRGWSLQSFRVLRDLPLVDGKHRTTTSMMTHGFRVV